MRINTITAFLLCLTTAANAQNLVFNGGFERQTPKSEAGWWITPPEPCRFSKQANIFNTSAQGWRTFDLQTPDLLHWDSINSCPVFPKPRRGARMTGLILFHPAEDGQFNFDYHEFIQGSLTRPLEKGKTYRVSFWVYSNDSLGAQHLNAVFGRTSNIRPTFCNNFGFYFSEGKIQTAENFMESQLDFPVKPQINHAEIVNTHGKWQKITLKLTAHHAYTHFLFGNFSFDGGTQIDMNPDERMALDAENKNLAFWAKTKRIAYYLFDDFAVVEDVETNIEQAFLKDKKFQMPSALLFDTGQSILKPESEPTIAALAEVLIKNTTLRIEIGGHTDNVGSEHNNQQLSEQRAQSLFQALLDKKVPPAQLRWKGYGESQPLATNDTETGRQKNRRVECRMMND